MRQSKVSINLIYMPDLQEVSTRANQSQSKPRSISSGTSPIPYRNKEFSFCCRFELSLKLLLTSRHHDLRARLSTKLTHREILVRDYLFSVSFPLSRLTNSFFGLGDLMALQSQLLYNLEHFLCSLLEKQGHSSRYTYCTRGRLSDSSCPLSDGILSRWLLQIDTVLPKLLSLVLQLPVQSQKTVHPPKSDKTRGNQK